MLLALGRPRDIHLVAGRRWGQTHGGPNPISQEVASPCHQILKALNSIHHDKEPGVPLESGLVLPSPCPVATPAERETGSASEDPFLAREAISLVCDAVPGAKGATRRRKVPGANGAGGAVGKCGGVGKDKHGDVWGQGQKTKGGGFWCGEPPASETLGSLASPVAARSVPSWGGVT